MKSYKFILGEFVIYDNDVYFRSDEKWEKFKDEIRDEIKIIPLIRIVRISTYKSKYIKNKGAYYHMVESVVISNGRFYWGVDEIMSIIDYMYKFAYRGIKGGEQK